MIGLEFVKSVDKNWKERITFADGRRYHDDFCPLNGQRCRRKECSLWNKDHNLCGFSMNVSSSSSQMTVKNLDDIPQSKLL